jgi:hypothetical protein
MILMAWKTARGGMWKVFDTWRLLQWRSTASLLDSSTWKSKYGSYIHVGFFCLPNGLEEKHLGHVLDPRCQYFLFIPALILKIHKELRNVQ